MASWYEEKHFFFPKMKSNKDKGDAISPVLSQHNGRDGRDKGTQQTIQSPPRVLKEQASRDEEPTERVVDKHDLGHPSENAVQQLDYHALLCHRGTVMPF